MTAKITAAQLVEAFRRYVAEGWGYVFGGQGELYREELAQKYTQAGRSVPSGRKKATYFTDDCAKWYGHRVADCSGGIVHTIQQYDPTFGDRTANTFNQQFTESGDISSIPETPGLAVWRSGHIGIYAGDGKVLEFRGTAYGCVETKLKSRNFTRWGKIRGVDYGEVTAQPTPATGKAFNGKCSGGSVYIRSSPAKEHTALGLVRKSEEIIALPEQNGWCEVGTVVNGKLVRGFMSARYIKQDSTDHSSTRAYPATCSGQGVNIRTGPGTENKSLGKVDKGTPMIAMPKAAGWCNIATALNGQITIGYMLAAYVKSR